MTLHLAIIHDIDGLPRAWGRAPTEEQAIDRAEAEWKRRLEQRAAEGTTDRSEERGHRTCTLEKP